MVIYAVSQVSYSYVPSTGPHHFMRPSQVHVPVRTQQQQPQQQEQQQPEQMTPRERFLARLRESRHQRDQQQQHQQQQRQQQQQQPPQLQRAHSFVPQQGANAFRPVNRTQTVGAIPPRALPRFARVTEENQKNHANSTRQVMSELKEMNALSFGQGQISVEMEGDSPFQLILTLTPNDGLYKDGYYMISMHIPPQYPAKKPSFHFRNLIFHPNVSTDGSICFSLLSESNSNLRLADYAHGMLWLLYYPNLYSRMNSDCPQNEKQFATLVRKSIEGGRVAGIDYVRSKVLVERDEKEKEELKKKEEAEAEEKGDEGKGKEEEDKEDTTIAPKSEWHLIGEEWIQFFEDDFDKIDALKAAKFVEEDDDDYYNACFAGHNQAQMADGSLRPLSSLRQGDLVTTGPSTPPSEIVCVVRTKINNEAPSLVHLPGGLSVTPTHPLRVAPGEGEWVFPRDISPPRETPGVPYIYSFVLGGRGEEGRGAGMVIEGVECIGLGHGVEGDNVASHPYFGTERVVEQLEGLRGWRRGEVTLGEGAFVRSEETGMLDGLRAEREIFDEE